MNSFKPNKNSVSFVSPCEDKQYEAFGNLVWQSGSFNDNREFTSKEKDPTGFHYFGARYYSGDIGRFLIPDPHTLYPSGLKLTNSQALNPYVYCNNDPLSYVDPNGEIPFLAALAIGAAISAGFNLAFQAIFCYNGHNVDINWGSVWQSALQGAFQGALTLGGVCIADALGGSTAVFALTQAATSYIGSGFDYVGIGPVNIPTNGDWIGANIGNIYSAIELLNELEMGGKVSWDWEALAFVSDKGPTSQSITESGKHAVSNYNTVYKGYQPSGKTMKHEFTHIWQKRFGGSWIQMAVYGCFNNTIGYWDNPLERQAFNRSGVDIYDALMGIDW